MLKCPHVAPIPVDTAVETPGLAGRDRKCLPTLLVETGEGEGVVLLRERVVWQREGLKDEILSLVLPTFVTFDRMQEI